MPHEGPALSVREDRVLIPLRVQPRASRTEIAGLIAETGQVKVRLRSPPVDGAANRELLKFLGKKVLAVPPSQLEIVHGLTGRDKVVAVGTIDLETVRERLGL